MRPCHRHQQRLGGSALAAVFVVLVGVVGTPARRAVAAPFGAWLRAWRGERQARGPKLVVRPWRRRALLEHTGGDADAANAVLRLLNSRRAMMRELEPLPLARFDVSSHGSRGLSAKHASLPDMILRLTGVGVVKAADERYIVTPPKRRTKLTSVEHLGAMGTAYVASDGTIWGVGNNSPYGAYKLDDLQHKVAMTRQLGGADDIKLVAAGRYKGTRMGWLAYAIPADAQSPQTVYQASRPRYQRAMGVLGARLRQLHDRGAVHLQMHPGNWFVRWVAGAPRVIISDWATAQKVDALPQAANLRRAVKARRGTLFEHILRDLSPRERAFALDLQRALSRSIAPEHDGVLGRLGFQPTDIAYRLETVIATLAGYHGWTLRASDSKAMVARLSKAYQTLAFDHLGAGGGSERGVHSYADLDKAHFGGMAQKSAMEELYMRVARASRQDPTRLLRDLRGSNHIVSAPTEWFDKRAR